MGEKCGLRMGGIVSLFPQRLIVTLTEEDIQVQPGSSTLYDLDTLNDY